MRDLIFVKRPGIFRKSCDHSVISSLPAMEGTVELVFLGFLSTQSPWQKNCKDEMLPIFKSHVI